MILGISAYYHDSAAALIVNGEIIAAVQEERFSRIKHDASFPSSAISYCLEYAGIEPGDLTDIIFYDKPLLKFERLLETYLAYSPVGIRSFLAAMPIWLKEKLYLKNTLKKELSELFGQEINNLPRLLFSDHHHSHAASAFYPSPFENAAILCMDGVGEWATTSVWIGENNSLTPAWEIEFPHSLGLLYSAFTYFAGFKVNSGEYKLMGLAPYGKPVYKDKILNHLVDVKDDGTFRMNMNYFSYATGLKMTNQKFADLFGGPPRDTESKITRREMDLAASIQSVTEDILLKLAKTIRIETGQENLCLAGGVALNCVANGKLLNKKLFRNIWIQPAAGDAGGAVGAALIAWYEYHEQTRHIKAPDAMTGAYLGPEYSNNEIQTFLDSRQAPYKKFEDAQLYEYVAEQLAEGKVVGWFQGRMEFGPRALGGRSILADPRNNQIQSKMNLKIKYRESFRPFAPSVLEEKVSSYFQLDDKSPYMMIVAGVNTERRIDSVENQGDDLKVEINKIRSDIPAVTHVDYSARIQTVNKNTSPRYYALIKKFEEKTGYGLLVNTSFNVRGEPLVCKPEDAYRCFMRTEMDVLVMENIVVQKEEQPDQDTDDNWKEHYELD
jgi:carbamoyltransferase